MKIYPGLIASDFLITVDDHSFRIWLWETQADLVRWAERYAPGRQLKGRFANSLGLFSPGYGDIDESAQHLGEVHFVKDRWDLEKVAHEIDHLQFHYIRNHVEGFVRFLYRYYAEWMDWEEGICYPFGEWVDWAYRWLCKKNPDPKWERETR